MLMQWYLLESYFLLVHLWRCGREARWKNHRLVREVREICSTPILDEWTQTVRRESGIYTRVSFVIR